MIFHETNFKEKNSVPWDPLRVPRAPILGPACGIFSKLNGPGPLGSVGHSHTSFSTGEFRADQRTLGSYVAAERYCQYEGLRLFIKWIIKLAIKR